MTPPEVEYACRLLARWLPREVLTDAAIQVGEQVYRCPECLPSGYLVPAAEATRGLITIKTPFWAPTTAAGIALMAHEFYHQLQFKSMTREQLAEYEYWERLLEEGKIQPWEHPLEEPAYRLEAQVYCKLLREGAAPGPFVPLGASVFGCSPSPAAPHPKLGPG